MLVLLKPHFNYRRSSLYCANNNPNSELEKILKIISKTTFLSIVVDNKFEFKIQNGGYNQSNKKSFEKNGKLKVKRSKYSSSKFNSTSGASCNTLISSNNSRYFFNYPNCYDTFSIQKIIEPILGIDILSAYGEIT
jgi:hypothetical protein